MNSTIEKIKIPSCVFFLVILGMLIDRIYLDFPYLQLDPKINLLNVANLLISILIAFLIPLYFKKLTEEKHDQKIFLIDDFKELITIVKKIKSIVSDAYNKRVFSTQDRDNIILTFTEAELKVDSIKSQISLFGNGSRKISEDLTEHLFEYNDYLTGGEMMLSSFDSVDLRFYTDNNIKYGKLETEIKNLIHKTYKL
ncbi:hypothetical protein M0Q50_00095 [bacterium]|jgi:hypothetical protein|nr:hypothetical protein [bacterium]